MDSQGKCSGTQAASTFRVGPKDFKMAWRAIRLTALASLWIKRSTSHECGGCCFRFAGGRRSLFPEAAQYGNWAAWLEQDGSADILSRIGFLKVAHHGSVNATPKDALEKMSTGKFAAMVSTQRHPWPSIPRGPLMDRLTEQTKKKIVRSDSLSIKNLPNAPKGPAVSKLPAGFVKGDFWYDHFIKL